MMQDYPPLRIAVVDHAAVIFAMTTPPLTGRKHFRSHKTVTLLLP